MSNPYHDPKTGEFASGPGAAAASGQATHGTHHKTGDPATDSVLSGAQEIAAKIQAPSYARIFPEDIGFRQTATHAEAAKRLAMAGFQKQSGTGNRTISTKMGRSEAHTSHQEKRSEFVHPAGHTASIKTTKEAYGSEAGVSKTYFNIRIKRS